MSVDVGCLGWQAGSSDIILKGDLLRSIPLKFGPNWPSSFREEVFKTFFPLGLMLNYVGWSRLPWLVGEVIGLNSERGPPKDHSYKVWSQ